MAIDVTVARHPVVAALSRVDETLDETAGAGVWSLGDADLLAALESSERLAARLAGLALRLVAEADTRGLAGAQGAPSTAALLRHRLRLDPTDAKHRVALANDPDLAGARAALCAGRSPRGTRRWCSTRWARSLPRCPPRCAPRPRRSWSTRPPCSTRGNWESWAGTCAR